MTNQGYLVGILVLIIVQSSSSLFVKLNKDSKSVCFYVNKEDIGDKLNLRFSYSGENEENVRTQILEKDGKKRKQIYSMGPNEGVNGRFTHKLEDKKSYDICFNSEDKQSHDVTFTYDSHAHVTYASQTELGTSNKYIDQLYQTIHDIINEMEMVRGNEYNHKKLLTKSKQLLFWSGITKVGMLVLFAAVNVQLLVHLIGKTQTKVSSLI